MLTDHGRCCFFGLLGYQLLTDGICDDVLDVVEGIAGETVIELMREEKGSTKHTLFEIVVYKLNTFCFHV